MKNKSGQHKILDAFVLLNMQDQNNGSQIFVMRTTSIEGGGILLESWDAFKEFIQGKYTDILYRQLYSDRSSQFVQRLEHHLNKLKHRPMASPARDSRNLAETI